MIHLARPVMLAFVLLLAGCSVRQSLRCAVTNIEDGLSSSDARTRGEAAECVLASTPQSAAKHLPRLLELLDDARVYRTVQATGGLSFGEARELAVALVASRAMRKAVPSAANVPSIAKAVVRFGNAVRSHDHSGMFGDPITNLTELTSLLSDYHRAGLGPVIATELTAQLPKIVNSAFLDDGSTQLLPDLRSLAQGRLPDSHMPAPGSPVPPSLPGRHGLTWGLLRGDKSHSFVAHCHAEPRQPMDRLMNGSCNPYQGDTACSVSLPILCIDPATRQLAASRSVDGTHLASRQAADKVCSLEFGASWRMAEHHDGDWGVAGSGTAPSDATRLWVAVDDQRANCWDSLP
jgi:hypothetical protein